MTRFGCFLFLLRCCLQGRRRWGGGAVPRAVGHARARAYFSNVTQASPDRFGVAMGHCMHATVTETTYNFVSKCEVFPILRGWGMMSNTRIMHTYVKCMSSIVIMHGPIDHEVSASYSHVSVLTRVHVGSWVDNVETVILAGKTYRMINGQSMSDPIFF